MHLEEVRKLGKKAGCKTDKECIFYLLDHLEDFFEFEEIFGELRELWDEAEKEGIELPGLGFGPGVPF